MTVDRYETGQTDAADNLARIAEATDRPVSWFTSADHHDAADPGSTAEFLAGIGERIAESRGRRGLTRRELADAVGVSLGKIERFETGEESQGGLAERIETVLTAPESQVETRDTSARVDERPELAEPGHVRDARVRLEQQLEETRAELTEARREHSQAAASNARLEAELERVTSERQRLADSLEQSRSALADARTVDGRLKGRLSQLEADHHAAQERADKLAGQLEQALTELDRSRSELVEARIREERFGLRVSQLESDLRVAEERVAGLTNRVGEAETEIERSRETERSLVQERDLRHAELTIRAAELERRETAIAGAEHDIAGRERALVDLERRAAEVEHRERAVEQRDNEHRAGVLAGLARRLDSLRAADIAESPPDTRVDEHLVLAPSHGYHLVPCPGAPPALGDNVQLSDGPYRCVRIKLSPIPGDDRLCAVLEPVDPAPAA